MKTAKNTLVAAGLIALAASQANAASYKMIVSTAEGSGAYNSTLSGTKVQTFDNLPGGVHENVAWNGVGTFDQLNIIPANVYGGAPSASQPNGTPYAVEGIGQVATTTLTLDKATSYFGLYWSAGDAANNLKFYNDGVLVADFTTANLMSLLPSSYLGNPLGTGNGGEPYGFINFIGDENTSWDTIVFGNTHGSGFEADNYTVRTNGWNPTQDGALPGTPMVFVESTDGEQIVSKIDNTNINGDGNVVLNVTNPNGSKIVTFAPAAPAAPAPPITIIAAFASVIALKGLRRKNTSA